MTRISGCKFSTDVLKLTEYLTRKSKNENVTLELSSKDNFYILSWGSSCIGVIAYRIINFFTRLYREGIFCFSKTAKIVLDERKVNVIARDLDEMINKHGKWFYDIWIQKKTWVKREPCIEKMDEKTYLGFCDSYYRHLQQKKTVDGNEFKAILAQLADFVSISETLEKSMPKNYKAIFSNDPLLKPNFAGAIIRCLELFELKFKGIKGLLEKENCDNSNIGLDKFEEIWKICDSTADYQLAVESVKGFEREKTDVKILKEAYGSFLKSQSESCE